MANDEPNETPEGRMASMQAERIGWGLKDWLDETAGQKRSRVERELIELIRNIAKDEIAKSKR